MFFFKLILTFTVAYEIFSRTTHAAPIENLLEAHVNQLQKQVGDSFDMAFLVKMRSLYLIATKMTMLALAKSKNADIRAFALNFIPTQQETVLYINDMKAKLRNVVSAGIKI